MGGAPPGSTIRSARVGAWTVAIVLGLSAMSAPGAAATTFAPAALAASLQVDPVQSINVPASSFTALSGAQIEALRAQIAKLDPGRIWIMIVPPRGETALGDLADPVFGDLPAGTLIAVAEDDRDVNQTNYWVGSSWEASNVSQSKLNGAISDYHKGQGSIYDDIRVSIKSFADADTEAGHPSLSAASTASEPGDGGGGGGSSGGGVAAVGLVLAGIAVITGIAVAVRHLRRGMQSSHVRHERDADAQAQLNSDFTRLGDQIRALDIDSAMPDASQPGKDSYAQALDCYQDAEQRMQKLDDAYQFQRAVDAVKHGLEHVHEADRLFNPARKEHQQLKSSGGAH
jgi:hypothetical protein